MAVEEGGGEEGRPSSFPSSFSLSLSLLSFPLLLLLLSPLFFPLSFSRQIHSEEGRGGEPGAINREGARIGFHLSLPLRPRPLAVAVRARLLVLGRLIHCTTTIQVFPPSASLRRHTRLKRQEATHGRRVRKRGRCAVTARFTIKLSPPPKAQQREEKRGLGKPEGEGKEVEGRGGKLVRSGVGDQSAKLVCQEHVSENLVWACLQS